MQVSSPPPVLTPSEQQHQQSASVAANNKDHTETLDWNNWTHDPIAVFTGLLTLFNGLLFASTIGLWLATRKSAGISERALVDLERPYIFLHRIQTDIGLLFNPGTLFPAVPAFHFTVINYGRTPGNIERAIIQFDILDALPTEPNIEEISVSDARYTSAVVIIGQTTEHTFRNLRLQRINLTKNERDQLKEKTLSLYCNGMFEYRDIFGKVHTTNFCRRLDFNHGEWVPEGERRRNESN